MGYRRMVFPVVTFFAVSIGFLFSACAEHRSSQSERDRIMALMNARAFGEASGLLEQELAQYPEDKGLALLLAEARLGLAHFEMPRFLIDVMARQNPLRPTRVDILPDCGEEAIEKFEGYDLRCLIGRAASYVPDVTNSDFRSARSLLDRTYPSAESTPVSVNFLMAFVEGGNAIAGARYLFQLSRGINPPDPTIAPLPRFEDYRIRIIIHRLKEIWRSVQQTCLHLRYSYQKIARFVTNLDGKPLLRAGHQQLVFSERTELADLLAFVNAFIEEKLIASDFATESFIAHGLKRISERIWNLALDLDIELPHAELAAWFVAVRGIQSAMLGLTRDLKAFFQGRARFHFLELVWKHPPRLICALTAAFSKTWKQEDPRPFVDYLQQSGREWQTLATLLNAWWQWETKLLSPPERKSLIDCVVRAEHHLPPAPPLTNGLDATLRWEIDRMSLWAEGIQSAIADGPRCGIGEETGSQAVSLLVRTKRWAANNL